MFHELNWDIIIFKTLKTNIFYIFLYRYFFISHVKDNNKSWLLSCTFQFAIQFDDSQFYRKKKNNLLELLLFWSLFNISCWLLCNFYYLLL